MLAGFGIDYIQGHYLGPPEPIVTLSRSTASA
jgi:EAL domain-containing protein (putative c-di-GMP-specific phosphodiesterase class I)